MKHYAGSIVRWYPDTNTGEFVNVGVICGRDDEEWLARWAIDKAPNQQRSHAHRAVAQFITDLGLEGEVSLLHIMWQSQFRHAKGYLELTPPVIGLANSVEEITQRFSQTYLRYNE